MSNVPADGHYLALLMAFRPEVLEQFQRQYGARTGSWEQPPLWRAPAPAPVVQALEQWVALCRGGAVDAMVAEHRAVELLLLLAQAGLAGNLLAARRPSWRDRVVHLLGPDPARPWEAVDVCRRLGVSDSSLRRHLRGEGTGFRELLEEVRLVAGLGLLQETFWPIARVAAEVGYESQSRFAERFKRRFGLTPSELRRTRLTVGGESLTDAGAAAVPA